MAHHYRVRHYCQTTIPNFPSIHFLPISTATTSPSPSSPWPTTTAPTIATSAPAVLGPGSHHLPRQWLLLLRLSTSQRLLLLHTERRRLPQRRRPLDRDLQDGASASPTTSAPPQDGVQWAEAASSAALRQYRALPKKGKPQGRKSAVLAAFLLSSPENPLNPIVLSLATDTKCLGAARLGPRGDLFHDAHAEVIARRALLHLIYAEIGTDNPPSWLVASGTDGRWRLKDGHQLHLYITQIPCGVSPVPPSPLEVRREQLDTMVNGCNGMLLSYSWCSAGVE
ncbi:tRNA-specific adenosine deaminase TAD1-like [Hordeum vulgare subsp. vulgare]|uniref:tRNA-specific adenosine deaminase TAD1-like n=1 Tax=Hordeum vulgare subsp. vulgare TaxID=112509 RepID=UPI001D1A386E|nr:tRNA-specific adenosine deaminase TAD1-like [Hordeum vulgare subsp. vulgare]